MTAAPLPIFLLPLSAIRKAMGQMSFPELLTISILSKNAKNLVTLLTKPLKNISICVDCRMSLKLVTESSDLYLLYFKRKQRVRIEKSPYDKRYKMLSLPGFTEKQWIGHIVCVFSHNNGIALSFKSPFFFRRGPIKETVELFKGLNIRKLVNCDSQIESRQLLKLFPTPNYLRLSNESICKSILVQNFETLELSEKKLTLNDILTTNCTNLEIHYQSLSDRDLNLLMKHWIRGSNHNLQSICVNFSREMRSFGAEVFKGIDHIKTIHQEDLEKIEFQRPDGMKAVVSIGYSIRNHYFYYFFQMRILQN